MTVATGCNRCYEASTQPLWVAQFVTRLRVDEPCERHRALDGQGGDKQ